MPKCGGHALAKMMSLIGIKYKSSFTVVDGKIVDSGTKHIPFSSIDLDLNTAKCYCLIRRLDDWWKSFMWHQSKHIELNDKGNINKITEKSYTRGMKERPGLLLLPRYTCHSTYPDYLLNQITFPIQPNYIRMEFLHQDFYSYFDFDLPVVDQNTSYNPPERYWTKETREILYKNNPKWAEIEANLYENRDADFEI